MVPEQACSTTQNFYKCEQKMESGSGEDLIIQISVAAGKISDMPEIFKNVRNSMQRLCQTCQTTSGPKFEHLKCFLFHENVLLFMFFFSDSLYHTSSIARL
ncbi:hypothetical protein TNCV_2623831 [Trichonephila clavipes]|nr:hypothetical protein TNCV_2623831 [Trichonephila clavipes]